VNYHEIKVDFADVSSITTDIKLKQFDYGNDVLRFMLYKDNVAYDPTADFSLCTIRCERSDGRVNENEIWKKDDESLCGITVVDDGVSYADVPYGFFESFRAGVVSFELIFYSFNDDGTIRQRCGLSQVRIEVYKSISSYNIVDKKSIDLIAHILEEMKAFKTTAEAQAYVDMLDDAKLAEEARVIAEELRIDAEQSRNESEVLRLNTELARAEAESERERRENTRTIEENQRIYDELTRRNSEEDRNGAEVDRANAEKERRAAEISRGSAETARGNAEALRLEAEEERKASELERKTNEKQRISDFAELSEKVNRACESASADATRIEEGVAAAESALQSSQKATQDAEFASTRALESTQKADTAAASAADAADMANAGAVRAEENAFFANGAALSATEAATRANSGAERAETAATNAETATEGASSAAERADNSAGNADEKAQLADDAAGRATTAAEDAESAAVKANDAADRADDALGLLPVVPIELSASGENITITDSAEARLRGLKLYGKSEQNGTPSPYNPVEIVSVGDDGEVGVGACGKNIFNDLPLRQQNTWSSFGVTCDYEGDGVFHVYGECVNDTTTIKTFNLPEILYRDTTIVIDPNKYYTMSVKMLAINQMSSRMHPYFRTTNGKATSNWLVVDISENTAVGATLSKTLRGGASQNDARAIDRFWIYFYIPAGTTAKYDLRFKVQLEEGKTPTAIEPYTEKRFAVPTPNGLPGIPVSSGGNYIDENGQMWLCDEVDFERCVYIQNIRNAVFSGGETYANTWYPQLVVTFANANSSICAKTDSPIISNCFASANLSIANAYGSSISIKNYEQEFENVDALKEFMATKYNEGDPVVFQYCLKTPIETPLSEGELAAYEELCTYYPVTNITNDSGAGMEVKYVADTKMYIDNEIAEMKEELTAAIVSE